MKKVLISLFCIFFSLNSFSAATNADVDKFLEAVRSGNRSDQELATEYLKLFDLPDYLTFLFADRNQMVIAIRVAVFNAYLNEGPVTRQGLMEKIEFYKSLARDFGAQSDKVAQSDEDAIKLIVQGSSVFGNINLKVLPSNPIVLVLIRAALLSEIRDYSRDYTSGTDAWIVGNTRDKMFKLSEAVYLVSEKLMKLQGKAGCLGGT